MFARNALNWLLEWKDRSNHKPLVVRGARQVGKTSLIEQFSKNFDIYLPFNLENPDDARLFSKEIPVKELFQYMLLERHQPRKGSILVFIDEIQNSAYAIKMLRYFYEELPEIYVIAAGSLLETMLNQQLSFPVGRVEYMALRPCSFLEFLGATDETEIQQLVANLAVPEQLHPKVMRLFNTYTLIGGMPAVVADYAENRDIVSLDHIYQSLLTGYIDDVEKYTKTESMRQTIRFIIQYGWQQAASRITFERFGNSNYKSREIGDAMRTLQKTMLLELAYPTVETSLPLSPDLKKKPKLLWLDTGLVNYAAGVQSEIFGKDDISDAWRGRIAEHIVGQEFLAQTPSFLESRIFWVKEEKNSQAEIDFIFKSRRYGIMPVEVKSGHNAHLKSLQLFMQQSPCTSAVRFWGQPKSEDKVELPSGKTFTLNNLPYYYAGMVEKIMQ